MTQDWKERYYITEFGRKCPPSQINTTLETIDEIIQSELDRQKEEIIKKVESKRTSKNEIDGYRERVMYEQEEMSEFGNELIDDIIKELKGT